ncbi:hypothetical protein MPS_3650 [Mycobacterium pseudoshottsii JCM 15466]|nr:hypothetical protein MPS_3650 [Mycobacterium pseudoshottsii JCM 15466]
MLPVTMDLAVPSRRAFAYRRLVSTAFAPLLATTRCIRSTVF